MSKLFKNSFKSIKDKDLERIIALRLYTKGQLSIATMLQIIDSGYDKERPLKNE